MKRESRPAVDRQELEVEIEKIVAGGDGLARHEGLVVFVPGVAPSERHRVVPVERRRDFLRATSTARLTEAPSRRPPPCPHAERCGGCSLMHLEPASQIDAKRSILDESLGRRGPGAPAPSIAIHVADELGYRARVRFHVSRRRRDDEPLAMGFRRKGTHFVEDIDRCVVATDGLNVCWDRLRTHFRAHPETLKVVDSIELQESISAEGRIVARFFVHSRDGLRKFDPSTRSSLRQVAGLDGLIVTTKARRGGPELRSGKPLVRHRITPPGGETSVLVQTAGSFFQTNRFLLETLLSLVRPKRPAPRIVDLYAGVGLFAIPLAERANEVVAVEASPSAVADGLRNRKRASLSNVDFVREDASRFARRFTFRETDYVVLDPPRGGLPEALRKALAASPLARLCYVSCDPPALGRDVRDLARAGFTLEALDLVDLFPNTHHFETVAHLERGTLDSRTAPAGY